MVGTHTSKYSSNFGIQFGCDNVQLQLSFDLLLVFDDVMQKHPMLIVNGCLQDCIHNVKRGERAGGCDRGEEGDTRDGREGEIEGETIAYT